MRGQVRCRKKSQEYRDVDKGKGIYDGDLFDNVVSSVSNLGQRSSGKEADPAEELRK